jgi:hypothetical protein
MKNKLLTYFALILFSISGKLLSQTYQLTGNPINTTGWDMVPSAVVSGDFIRLTTDQIAQVGGIKLAAPYQFEVLRQMESGI